MQRSSVLFRIGMLAVLLPWPSGAFARDASSLKEFPLDLVHGVREEVRPEGLLTLGAGGGAAAIARFGGTTVFDDNHIATALIPMPVGKRATDFMAVAAHPAYLLVAMGATYFSAWAVDADPGTQEFALLGFESLTLAGIQTEILKYSVPRLRPDHTDLAAFPSGHTSGAFALATVAGARFGWKIGLPAYVVAGFVGYSRMEGRHHYLSDVLFGAGLGIASGRAVFKARRRSHPEKYVFAPFIYPGGAGVEVYF